ncbi:MAG TPA: DUF4350 domain-containing protein [Sphingomicrobium sp.]|nr:DUF4350 domain-containing protein [Sphingomicrobium sp.]
MSDIAIGAVRPSESPFNRRTMLWVTAVGVLAFVAMLVLGAYAPDLRSGRNGGTHALSNAAVGFSGLVRLAEATGRNPEIVRSEAELERDSPTIVSPDHGYTDISDVLGRRGGRTTLLVLPKWMTMPDRARSGWVRVPALIPREDPEATLAPDAPLSIRRSRTGGEPLTTVDSAAPAALRFFAPKITQTASGEDLRPVITDASGRIVLGQLGDSRLFILADPDLINNHGMGDQRQARAALALLDYLNSGGSNAVLFDVTANGLGRSRSPLKLAFDPPFLAVTLTIFVAMLLAGFQALVRFGSPRRPERAIAFGKSALVDNSAALIRKAGREARLGARYVDVIRERAAVLFRLAPTLDREAVDMRMEALNPRRSFAELANAASQARSRDELLGVARSLHHWVKEVQE